MGQVESKGIICISMDLHGQLIPFESVGNTSDVGLQNRKDLYKFIDVKNFIEY